MKLWIRVLLVIVLVFLGATSFLHVFISVQGKSILISKLTRVFHKEVTVGDFSTDFPFNLNIRDLEVKDTLKVDKAFVRGGIIDIFRGRLVLSELRLSNVVFDIEKPAKKPEPEPPAAAPEVASPGPQPLPGSAAVSLPVFRFPGIVLRRLFIENGTFNFTDRSVGDPPVIIIVKDLSLTMENLHIPVTRSTPTAFEIKGSIPWQDGQAEGKLALNGWVNLYKKDVEARLQLGGVDAHYIQPYYVQWINLDKARIQQAKLNFSSDIHGLNNNLTAECRLELTDVVIKPRDPSDGKDDKTAKIAATILGVFKSLNQGRVVLDFTVRTKMDSPEFGLGIIQNAFQDKITQSMGGRTTVADVVMLPGKMVGNTVGGAANISLAVIDGTVAIGKALFGGFKKENQE